MDRPSVDQVRAIIGALYNDSDPNGKEKASEWLHELQRSVRVNLGKCSFSNASWFTSQFREVGC